MFKNVVLKHLSKKKGPAQSNSTLAYQECNDVGIIFGEEMEVSAGIDFLRTTFVNEGKQVFPLMRVSKHQKDRQYNYPFFINKEINLLGQIESDFLKTFINRPLDILIVLDEISNPIVQFVVSKCKCPLRIGYYSENDTTDFLNFLIKPENDDKEHQELMSYVRMIS